MPYKNREATRAAWRKYYYKHKARILSERAARVSKVVRAFTALKASTPCADCGNKYPPECMEFDHLRDKKGYISDMIRTEAREALLEELEKCELVCANCHNIRTAARRKKTIQGSANR